MQCLNLREQTDQITSQGAQDSDDGHLESAAEGFADRDAGFTKANYEQARSANV